MNYLVVGLLLLAVDSDHHTFKVRSVGTEPSAKVRVSAKGILWADIIFAMEKGHKERLEEQFPDETGKKRIIMLDIEDEYRHMDDELIAMIRSSIAPYLDHL